eukprot:2749195-Rhodomonas_salina.3
MQAKGVRPKDASLSGGRIVLRRLWKEGGKQDRGMMMRTRMAHQAELELEQTGVGTLQTQHALFTTHPRPLLPSQQSSASVPSPIHHAALSGTPNCAKPRGSAPEMVSGGDRAHRRARGRSTLAPIMIAAAAVSVPKTSSELDESRS